MGFTHIWVTKQPNNEEKPMDDEILTIFCICDDLLKTLGYTDHPQAVMSNAEVMLVAIVAARSFGGNIAAACRWLNTSHWIPNMLRASRLNRRLHRIKDCFLTLFAIQSATWKTQCVSQIFNVDTFPIPVCDNIRIKRCQIYQDEIFRGYKASKRRYFYGLKLHLLVSQSGKPIEFFLTPGSTSDTKGILGFDLNLPQGSIVIADKAYNIYWYEDLLAEYGIKLMPIRKKNSKRPHEPWERGLQWLNRQTIETSGSLINQYLPSSIHAVTAEGFELKVVLFVLAFSLSFIFK